MSTTTPSDRYQTTTTHHTRSINAGIDSSFTNNPLHRGSLTPSELDSIHQTNSFKKAVQLQEEDTQELTAKMNQLQREKESKNIVIGVDKEIIVESPFYLRARILDSHTVNVQFEIGRENEQRSCQNYKFTIRRNQENPYSMPEQNLTFWRNSLELQHLSAGQYQVCAIICSEHLPHVKHHNQSYMQKNRTLSIKTCVHFQAFRPHLLVLTLYVLVIIFLTISQIIFSLRKRRFHERMKWAKMEVENSLQKLRTTQISSSAAENTQSYNILRSLVTLPATPVDYSVPSPPIQSNDDEQRPIIFHLEPPNES
ncbi:hypothetical protein I4U23_030080 [Adineta vaga]|nr:hypothetical protein I4U23_030080 [Adineta vaga]